MARVRPQRATVVWAVLASVLAALAGAAWAWLLGPLLQGLLVGAGEVRVGRWALSPGALVLQLPLAVVGVALLKALAGWVHAGLMQQVSQAVLAQLRKDLYARLLELPPAWYETRHSGELVARFSSDVTQVEFAVGQALSSWAKDSLQVLALLGVCLAIDVRLFALAFVVLPLMALPVSAFAKALKKTATTTQASLGALTVLASEQLHNLPIVQGYRAEGLALARFDAEQGRYLRVVKRSLFIRGAFTPTLEVLAVLGVALCVAVGAQAVSSEPALAARLVSFLTATLLMYQPLKALAGTFSMVAQGVGAAGRLFEVLDAEPERDEGAQAGPLARGVRFEGVRVRYSDGRLGLDSLSLEVPAGKLTALVGPSGGGKSTTLSVLLGFVAPEAGTVSWDGTPLGSYSKPSVRRRIAWVSQEPVLLSGTVRENLLLGVGAADDAALWQALERAHAHAFVRALPRGLEEQVGERGARLSGGQRQRLALARAFLREPSLLLLDEPTSALDAESDCEVQAGIDALMKGRTTLVVAHRLSTVQRADVIHVLEHGRCIESGTHAQLVAKAGLYSRLVVAASRDRL